MMFQTRSKMERNLESEHKRVCMCAKEHEKTHGEERQKLVTIPERKLKAKENEKGS